MSACRSHENACATHVRNVCSLGERRIATACVSSRPEILGEHVHLTVAWFKFRTSSFLCFLHSYQRFAKPPSPQSTFKLQHIPYLFSLPTSTPATYLYAQVVTARGGFQSTSALRGARVGASYVPPRKLHSLHRARGWSMETTGLQQRRRGGSLQFVRRWVRYHLDQNTRDKSDVMHLSQTGISVIAPYSDTMECIQCIK